MTIQYLKANNLILFEVLFEYPMDENSKNICGVFYVAKNDFFGLNYISQVADEINNSVYYEIGKFIELLQKNDPKMLELLASPENQVLYKHPVMDLLKPDYFLSKLCKCTFVNYAISQIKQVSGLQRIIVRPIKREQKSILDFCFILHDNISFCLKEWLLKNKKALRKCGLAKINNFIGIFAIYYDEAQTLGYNGIIKDEEPDRLLMSTIPKKEKPIGYLYFNEKAYTDYCKEYKEYWKWVSDYKRYLKWTEIKGYPIQEANYDLKNMIHTICLLKSCEQIFKNGSLKSSQESLSELLDINIDNCSYESIKKKIQDIRSSIEYYYNISNLPVEPDLNKTNELLLQIREQLYYQ